MKIARTIESFYPFMSGPANQAYQISKRLDSPIFTTFYKAKAPAIENMDGVKVFRFKIAWSFMKFLYTPGFTDAIIKYEPDIIHAHNYRSYQTHAAYKLARKRRIPFVLNTHGSLLGYDTITKGANQIPYKIFDMFGKTAVLDADAVVVSSKQERKEAIRFGVDQKKLHVIPMGISVDDYLKIPRNRTDRIRLLFVGRICRDRNLMPIIKALKLLGKDYELRIVGGVVKRTDTEKSGYMNELKKYVKNNKLNAVFTGPIYGDELKAEYRNADIFVYTSLWENFGQTILEAGAAGLPLVTTKVGIAEDLVTKETGHIVNSVNQMVKAIKDLDDKKRMIFSRNIVKIIRRDFEWKSIIEKYQKIYQKW